MTAMEARISTSPVAEAAESAVTIEEEQHHNPLSVVESSFDQCFELPKCKFPPKEEYEPVEKFVAEAVKEQHEQIDDTEPLLKYKGLLETFRYHTDLVMLQRLCLALRTSANGGTLDRLTKSTKKHARLIHVILRLNPFSVQNERDYELAEAHLMLLIAIVSANTVFLVPILSALWKMLSSSQAPPEQTTRIHATLRMIVQLCPKAKTELFPILASNCPFRLKPRDVLNWYYRQCLVVVKYIPSIQSQVLELLIDKSLEMDVEIKINDGGEAVIDEEEPEQDIFQLDIDTNDPTVNATTSTKTRNGTVDEMADKLDALMLLLFEYVEQSIKDGTTTTSTLFGIFSRVFESSVLITHKSKFVQFLLLHLCGIETQLSMDDDKILDGPHDTLFRCFAAKLIDVIVDPYRATATRQTGACYLASFVSRARYVCAETVCESVCALLRWADAYIQSLTVYSIYASDAREQCNLHSLFYTVCQSAFYIMCFRGPEAYALYQLALDPASDIDSEHVDIGPQRWSQVCAHALQPLRYCLESVRHEFLHVSKQFQLVDAKVLERLMEDDRRKTTKREARNKRIHRIQTAATLEMERQTGGVGGLGQGGENPLDSFFPFDPYLLRQSHSHIEPFYKHWGETEEEIQNVEDTLGDDDVSLSENDSSSDEDSAGNSDDDDSNRMAISPWTYPMSLTSQTTNGSSVTGGTTPETVQVQKQALLWNKNVGRSRAPSIENGSW